MSLGLFNCRLIQSAGDQLFCFSAVLPHGRHFGRTLFSLPVKLSARPDQREGAECFLSFLLRKGLSWFSAGSPVGCRGPLPPIDPPISPILPTDSAIEPNLLLLDCPQEDEGECAKAVIHYLPGEMRHGSILKYGGGIGKSCPYQRSTPGPNEIQYLTPKRGPRHSRELTEEVWRFVRVVEHR
jgi:hypothetical protein